MAPKIDQATLIILDISKNTLPEGKEDGSFFQEAKSCVQRIIEKKIMSRAKHYLGLILLGSQKTRNELANQCPGAFKHIELKYEVNFPTWDMIRNLPDSPSTKKGDWVDALIVGADYFKNGISGVNIQNRKILLLTNFRTPSKMNVDIENVIDGFKQEKYEVDIIGPDIYNEAYDKNTDVTLARQFVEETEGATETFENTMRYLLYHKKKVVKALPWNVDLSIGDDIKIPVSSYIRLKNEPVVPTWTTAVMDLVTDDASTKEVIKKEKVFVNNETKEVISDKAQTVKGYVYGGDVIPLSKCDEGMLYKSGEKCLSVFGFAHQSSLKWQNLNGNGLSYLFGRKGDKKAQYAVRCLVECLHELKLFGIARKVYNNGNAPKMLALMPVLDTNDYICLSLAEICFKDDIKYMTFPQTTLKKYDCTKEQVDAFKDLIKAMDLTNAYDDSYDDKEAFSVAATVSPAAQYVLDSIAFRAVNPGKPLPPPRDEIMMLFKIPPMIEKRSREPLEAIQKLFTLKKVEAKSKKKTTIINTNVIKQETDSKQTDNKPTYNTEMPKIKLPIKKTALKISTVDPIKDFKEHVNNGKTLTELAPEMTDAIESIMYSNLEGTYTKAVTTMMFFRNECLNTDPSPYNNWLLKFKVSLLKEARNDIVELIEKKNLNYIVKDENSLSGIETGRNPDESQLYECDTVPNTCDFEIGSDIDDMFDDM